MARRLIALAAVAVGCGGGTADQALEPRAAPLPVGVLLGQRVVVYPITLVAAEAALGWDEVVGSRDHARSVTDSLIAVALTERTPEVDWVLPDALRRAAAQAPGMLTNPDRMATAVLRRVPSRVPDPLRSQMRTLTGVAGDRLALVPASLMFVRTASGAGEAELTLVLTDVRLGEVRWRSVVRAEADDPWLALRQALETLAPDVPR